MGFQLLDEDRVWSQVHYTGASYPKPYNQKIWLLCTINMLPLKVSSKIGIFETRVVIIILLLLPLRLTFLAAVVSWPLFTPKIIIDDLRFSTDDDLIADMETLSDLEAKTLAARGFVYLIYLTLSLYYLCLVLILLSLRFDH